MIAAEVQSKQTNSSVIRGELLSIEEVAPQMRYSGRWIRQMIKEGTFPIRYYRVGPRGILVDSADLNDWLIKMRVEPGIPVTKFKKEVKR